MRDDVEANPEKHAYNRYAAALANFHRHLIATLERSQLPALVLVLITP